MLETIDLDKRLAEDEYDRRLLAEQLRLFDLELAVKKARLPVVLVFEGWDAAGKGGAIKRLTERLDPRGVVAHSIAGPHGEDRTHHYLYRFWRRLPERGQICIFDRSWYGRVLVERVEGFCAEEAWRRAYREINEFERQLVRFGTVLCKFWIHISKDEQLRRFEERSADPMRSWKLTDEDWRNREKWDLYREAVDEMLVKTSTVSAPWTIVEGNDKCWARVKVIRTVNEALERALGK